MCFGRGKTGSCSIGTPSDSRCGSATSPCPDRVVTHGEPHPGNVLWAGENRFLLDWDTVGLAVRERDLAFATDEELLRYEELTGHRPDPVTLSTYRLRWDLDEVAVYVELFRQPHARTEDTGLAWAELAEIVARL
ncbi:phosphotransferase family protein [Amycolatopsis lurida]